MHLRPWSWAGLKVDRSIIVNERLETNITDIYACGDCAQYEGINYAIWPQAIEMGRVAGAKLVGAILIGDTSKIGKVTERLSL